MARKPAEPEEPPAIRMSNELQRARDMVRETAVAKDFDMLDRAIARYAAARIAIGPEENVTAYLRMYIDARSLVATRLVAGAIEDLRNDFELERRGMKK